MKRELFPSNSPKVIESITQFLILRFFYLHHANIPNARTPSLDNPSKKLLVTIFHLFGRPDFEIGNLTLLHNI